MRVHTQRKLVLFCLLAGIVVRPPHLASAATLEVYAPRTEDRATIELEPGEKAELTVHLKSFGDPMENHKVWILDDFNRKVGSTNSEPSGVITFSNLPAGRFRVFVERKRNPRGGATTVTVGDLRLEKLANE